RPALSAGGPPMSRRAVQTSRIHLPLTSWITPIGTAERTGCSIPSVQSWLLIELTALGPWLGTSQGPLRLRSRSKYWEASQFRRRRGSTLASPGMTSGRTETVTPSRVHGCRADADPEQGSSQRLPKTLSL